MLQSNKLTLTNFKAKEIKNEKKFIRYTTKWNFTYRKLFWGNETIY